VDRLSLNVEDQLLVALEYWREYRSQFHISYELGLHETTVGRIVRKVENVLMLVREVSTFFGSFLAVIATAENASVCVYI